jgi:hypothetical protein
MASHLGGGSVLKWRLLCSRSFSFTKPSLEESCFEVSIAEVGVAEVSSFEVRCSKVNSLKAWAYFWMLLSPCIPSIYSLPKQKVILLLVCHHAPLLCGVHIIEGLI